MTRLTHAFRDAGLSELADKVEHCSRYFRARVCLTANRETAIHPMSCDCQVCPVCNDHRERTTRKKARYVLDFMPQRIRMFTLTWPRTLGSAREAADRCMAALERLRRGVAWRERILGALVVYEATWSKASGWLAHLHVLASGRYWPSHREHPRTGQVYHPDVCPCQHTVWHDVTGRLRINDPRQRCLSCEWYRCTDGAAYVVDARLVDSTDKAIAEVTKYVTKGSQLSNAAAVDWVTTMRQFTRVRWYGEWFGINEPESVDMDGWLNISPTLVYELAQGNPEFIQLEARCARGNIGVIPAEREAHYEARGPPEEEDPLGRVTVLVVLDSTWAQGVYSELELLTDKIDRDAQSKPGWQPEVEVPF